MENLIHLIYNSAATRPFSDADLQQLLSAARNKNASLNVTGMLLYVDGGFFQILEGPEAVVDRLLATIHSDARHTRVTTIIRESIPERSFGEWTMGYATVRPDEHTQLDGLNDFFGAGDIMSNLYAGRAKKLLTAFKQGRWRAKLAAPAAPAAVVVSEPQVPETVNVMRATSAANDSPRAPFTFAFQPIVNAVRRQIIGYEALVRGAGGEPAASVLQRLPLEEIAAFDEDAHRKAIALASRLGLRTNLHLNVARCATNGDFQHVESVIETAKRCGIDPSKIVLEIKHEASTSDPAALSSWLRTCRAAGLKICIDDFGSGHAGLALLDHYQPETISLSMWMSRSIHNHGPRQAIIRGLIQTCSDLGIEVISKGVESNEEYTWLRENGIECFQGYLLAKPGLETLVKPMLPSEIL